MVTLTNKHIIIHHQIVERIFANTAQVTWVYYPAKGSILIASQYDEPFKKLHKTVMSMLKYKNNKGDRSISIEELLIDNDIKSNDRILEYKINEKMKILSILLTT